MKTINTDLVVLGAGPGGFAAAIQASSFGKNVVLVDQNPRLGGVCLNWGCIPSKSYLHAANLIEEVKSCQHRGIIFSDPKIDIDKMRAWKESILDKLSTGMVNQAKQKNVKRLIGRGYFEDSNTLRVESNDGQILVKYQNAIIAVGSIPFLPSTFDLGNSRIMTSDKALELEDIPNTLLVVGGGLHRDGIRRGLCGSRQQGRDG